MILSLLFRMYLFCVCKLFIIIIPFDVGRIVGKRTLDITESRVAWIWILLRCRNVYEIKRDNLMKNLLLLSKVLCLL